MAGVAEQGYLRTDLLKSKTFGKRNYLPAANVQGIEKTSIKYPCGRA